jgi:folylpolyglutamate synthase/dihydrofolate synthase
MIVDRRQLRDKVAWFITLLKREPAPKLDAPLPEDWLDYIPRSILRRSPWLIKASEWLGLDLHEARATITVGGTNGKGSTCAMLEQILLEAGYHVGLYTSPHLLRYNERVRFKGEEATDNALVDAFERVEKARKGVPLTYFEFGTLAALTFFAQTAAEVVILEVGAGASMP